MRKQKLRLSRSKVAEICGMRLKSERRERGDPISLEEGVVSNEFMIGGWVHMCRVKLPPGFPEGDYSQQEGQAALEEEQCWQYWSSGAA